VCGGCARARRRPGRFEGGAPVPAWPPSRRRRAQTAAGLAPCTHRRRVRGQEQEVPPQQRPLGLGLPVQAQRRGGRQGAAVARCSCSRPAAAGQGGGVGEQHRGCFGFESSSIEMVSKCLGQSSYGHAVPAAPPSHGTGDGQHKQGVVVLLQAHRPDSCSMRPTANAASS